ncbi:MAG: outer membrane beta-barrel protein [Oryzomonas sp.]|uniref:porin family protein n=1 Tax=Oryzomonas sp. TaxID=2855186 RepID=UPI002851683D|nr:outer membrane beta-barrel protein [Oryzomonas sp.]MDR3578625.1 outer membrane beta-barrel protein [Oryzomonas sp.]
MKRVCACAAMSLVLAFCGTVFGAVSEGQFSVSPMIGGYTYDGGLHLNTAPVYSLKGGYSLTANIGVEAGLDYSITNSTLVTDKNVAIFKYGVEGLYHFMPDGNLVPFLALGLGGYNLSGPSALVSRKEMGFMDYGGGLKYFLNDNLALRADVRHIVANAGAFEYLLGVTIPFGGVKGEIKTVAASADAKAALAEKRLEQAETPRTAPPVPPAVVAPEENIIIELSPSEKLARLKEEFAKEELERITTFKAEWEKKQESRSAAEKAARAQEALDQVKTRNEQGTQVDENISAEAAKQTGKESMTDSNKKSTLTKSHKTATKKKQHKPATPQ